MTVTVVLSTGSTEMTGGETRFELEARNLRGVIRQMDERYPGIGAFLEEETTVAIDGEIQEHADYQVLPDGTEVFFLPKLEAG